MRPRTAEDYRERLLTVLVYIQRHLEELARVACFSPYHFHRLFAGMMGETVAEHVRRLRLERATHGRELRAAPALEVYLNDPRKTAPEKLRTEIYMPLEPAAP